MNLNNKEIKYQKILDKYNVQDRKSYEILKFYAEDLNEIDKKLFIELILSKKGWELGTDICRLSRSENLIQYFESEYAIIIQSWFNERLTHSERIRIDTRFPNLPNKFIKEFIEIFVSVKNLGFKNRHLEIIEEFFRKSNRNYLKGFFETIFRVIVHDFNVEETVITFLYFTKKFISLNYNNYSDFLCCFLLEFITSDKIFSTSEKFDESLDQLLVILPQISALESNSTDLTSYLLIHLIRDNNTNFNNIILSDLINLHLNKVDKGRTDHLFLFQFLERFNFKFENYKFDKDINTFLDTLDEQLLKISEYHDSPDSFRRSASYYTKEAGSYVELFLFYLSKLQYVTNINHYIERFIVIVDQLRNIFQTVFWMKEYINFEQIPGKIFRATNSGFLVKIEENYFKRKLEEYQLEQLSNDDNFMKTNSFAFIKEKSIFEVQALKSYSMSLSNNKFEKDDLQNENFNFFINDVNLALSNRGCTATVSAHTEKFSQDVNYYGLKAVFCELELFLISTSYELLASEVNYSSNFFKNHKFNLRRRKVFILNTQTFWEVLKKHRYGLYNNIYLENEKKELLKSKLYDALQNKTVVDGEILSTTNGGFLVDIFGARAFLPGSQVELKVIEDYSYYVGKTYTFHIIDFDHASMSIIVSRRSILEPIYEKKRDEFKRSIEINNVYKGSVKNITSYGAFIDLGGVDGLVHINDLSWRRLKHPNEILSINDELDVKILDFDEQKAHIYLGVKQLKKNPWEGDKVTKLEVGAILKGKITLISEYGIFVELFDDIEGLIYKTDIPTWDTPHFSKNYNVGDPITVKVKLINIDENKIGLFENYSLSDPWNNIEKSKLLNVTTLGAITAVSQHGIFVEISSGITGLIHISDFSWNRDPNYISQFNIGDSIMVTVKKVNIEKKRIALNYRFNSHEFWNFIAEIHNKKIEILGRIEFIRDKKIFVLLNENISAYYYTKGIFNSDTLKPGDRNSYLIEYFNIARKIIIVRPHKNIKPRRMRLQK